MSAQEMRELDRETIECIGIPGAVLMENAGRAVVDCVLVRRPKRVLVLCGGGNNGGDGFVIARVLHRAAIPVVAIRLQTPSSLPADAAIHHRVCENSGVKLVDVVADSALDGLEIALDGVDVIVDAIFGTGLRRAVSGHFAAVIERVNRWRDDEGGAVIAVDLPSGLSADTGQPMGVAITADQTVVLGHHKVATAASPGFARCGAVHHAEIGIREAGDRCSAWLVEPRDLVELVPVASDLDYKTKRGHVLVVGGSEGHWGAGRLAAQSALRAGAGLVSLAGPVADRAAPASVMTLSVRDIDFAGMASVALGPGMEKGASGAELTETLVRECELPMVLDADALNHLAARPELWQECGEAVITPHPGEAGRLLGSDSRTVQSDRFAAARALVKLSGKVVVLKGARPIVAHAGGLWVVQSGGPSLATAGSGDVLTGLIAGLLAQGLGTYEAALCGAWVHGVAGAMACEGAAPRSVTSADLAELVGKALAQVAKPPTP